MRLRYDGPRESIGVLIRLDPYEIVLHRRGDLLDYPEALGKELLAEVRNQFVEIREAELLVIPPSQPAGDAPPAKRALKTKSKKPYGIRNRY